LEELVQNQQPSTSNLSGGEDPDHQKKKNNTSGGGKERNGHKNHEELGAWFGGAEMLYVREDPTTEKGIDLGFEKGPMHRKLSKG